MERIVTHQTEPVTHTDGARENQQKFSAAPTDDVTGWEAEREILFNPSLAFAEDKIQSHVAAPNSDFSGIVGDVARLGKSIEHLGDTPPISDATTKPQPRSGKKKKLGIGQKKDDNSGYDYTMTM